MSHYTRLSIQAQQSYEAELVEALQQHFGEDAVEAHGDKKVPLKDWQRQNTDLKANIVISKDMQSRKIGRHMLVNDLGYERTKEGGYDVHADVDGFPKAHQDLVAQYYAEKVASKKLKQQGFAVKRQQLDDGRIQLTATRYA